VGTGMPSGANKYVTNDDSRLSDARTPTAHDHGTPTDDNLRLGNGAAWVNAALPSCSNATTSKLLYDTATNTFSCGTDQGGAAGCSYTGNGPYSFLVGTRTFPRSDTRGVVDAAATAANGFIAYQFVLTCSLPLNEIFVLLNGGCTAAGKAWAFAIYDDSANTVGTKVTGTDVAVTGGNAVVYKTATWGTQPTLPAGTYWIGFAAEEATCQIYGETTATYAPPTQFMVNLPNKRYVKCPTAATWNGTSSTLPSTCGVQAAGAGIVPWMVNVK
jgi:hypothetical protein